ncbi:MAG TPA: ATP-binding protein [Pyrinomonadaceae bacterium]|jgi:signal transduction histidine kinase
MRSNLFYSFRVRLLILLAGLLVMTLGAQYYLNLRAERNRARILAEQEQAIMAAVGLGMSGISSGQYMDTILAHAKQPLLTGNGRVTNILVVTNEGNIWDSLKDYNPVQNDDGTIRYFQLEDIPLPPLINAIDLPGDTELPTAVTAPAQSRPGQPRAIPIPVETDKGRWYVIVVLGAANVPTSWWNLQAARPLVYTLSVLLVAMFFMALLVWRFTQPIKDLSYAARRVAAGDLDFRVPITERRDEVGTLSSQFNEMIAQLGRTRELEARLHQAERSAVVGRLASAIAHEIRNPLNYINLTLDHLRTSLAPEDETKRATVNRLANQLKAEVARINTRISEFLNYTRPSRLELRPLDLRAVAEDALRIVEGEAAEHGIETRVETQGEVPTVLGDRESLRSVFTNLFINALQAIDGQGGSLTITLGSVPEEQQARIDITDTGRGIAPEHISQVFEPYFSTKETGTGLGLAIVKKAIEDHGGTISVRSQQGRGTTFIITLPMERKEE